MRCNAMQCNVFNVWYDMYVCIDGWVYVMYVWYDMYVCMYVMYVM